MRTNNRRQIAVNLTEADPVPLCRGKQVSKNPIGLNTGYVSGGPGPSRTATAFAGVLQTLGLANAQPTHEGALTPWGGASRRIVPTSLNLAGVGSGLVIRLTAWPLWPGVAKQT